MITTVVAWLVSQGLPERAAKSLLIAGIILGISVAVAGGAALWLHLHDSSVIADHDAAQDARDTAQALNAERGADANAAARSIAAQQHQEELSNVQQAAEAEDPVGAAHAVGPATGAVVDELRHQHPAAAAR
jgi:hypothetical protein